MASRLPYRKPADAQRKRLRDERQRNLRRSRSEAIVTRSTAFQSVAEGPAVVAQGYVSASNAGAGLGTPLLELPLQPVSATPGAAITIGPYGFERVTSAATFETLFAHVGIVQNVVWQPIFAVRCSDAGTAGEMQAVDLLTGTPLLQHGGLPWLATIAAGTVTDVELSPTVPLVAPGAWADAMRLGVQVRRTAGVGTITVSAVQSLGG